MKETLVLADWLSSPETRAGIERCVQRALGAMEGDIPLRVPRDVADQKRGFERWLARYRTGLGPLIQREFTREFPKIASEVRDPDAVRKTVDEHVWPEVDAFLRAYAARGLAASWVRDHFGDATTIGSPTPTENGWRVPLGLRCYRDDLGQVILDRDGRVVVNLTTTREELLEAAGGRSRSSIEAAARQ